MASSSAGAVGLVVVHWNQPARLADTLAAFEAQGVALTVVVVDNGSRPDRLAAARLVVEAQADAEMIEMGRNAGFGPAANVGFRRWLRATAQDLVLLAPHDALPEPDCVERLVACLREQPSIGLASADVGDGETPVIDPYFGPISRPAEVEAGFEAADYPHGTLLAARRDCLLDVGFFDERYFSYCEESDLGLRAIAGGWDVGIVRGADVRNPGMGPGHGPPVVDYLMLRNTLLLVRTHSGRYHAFIRFCVAVIDLIRGVVAPASRPAIFSRRGRSLALVDVLRHRYGTPPASLFSR